MEIETTTIKYKAQKRTIDETGNIEMGYVHTSKNAKTQEIEEEEIETRLVETKPNQPGFQVTLEGPVQVVASSSSNVAILSLTGSVTTTEPSWPTRKAIE